MKRGSDKGKQTCLGAKIDMKSNNGALRDPAIYHLKLSHIHAMVQNITSIPPTISLVQSLIQLRVSPTHFVLQNIWEDQYFWFIEKLGLWLVSF